ncbi:VOC family protein [Clostridium aminobutyricum]|uniref:VOC family protein n=1 Tax=Clostridium aminobutyricum TaxID=33953 RepID=A0A939D957_CLOAM|nr:VOC family protein [Clostridium aminobutyricum]MBN7773491.1 VOC family protein [Clostridium aminobutyricum]
MKFCWSTLRVKNLEESIAFYTEIIGLEVARRFNGGPSKEIVFLGDSETKIELVCDGESRDTNVGKDISWGFETESLDKALELVKEKGIPVVSGPIQPNPHVKFFFIKDPDGMLIQLVEHMA